ncbi:venom factor-like [Bufo gargarizans]|uniref:venom factor-like n=1 Tax=Bufo gargarizans TaxID=30331 RepID=UPI001CF3157C|nr:venom factor-like [Bufo gargarizans]
MATSGLDCCKIFKTKKNPASKMQKVESLLCSLITPNVLRVDSEETIIVDGHGTTVNAEITAHDFPRKKYTLVSSRVSVNSDNKFFGDVKLTIPSNNLEKDPNKKQYVYVTVKSPTCNLENVVLVSYQSGYIFIQTDKPIYTPGSTVLYRIFTMTPKLKPVSKPVIIEFLTPENVIVKKDLIQQNSKTGIISMSHKLPDLVSLGIWTVSAKFEDTLIQNYTTQFEVKEYVLPSFEIKVTASQKYFYIKDNDFRVDIEATYLYGEPVQGKAFVIFGLERDNEKKTLPETLRRVDISEGAGFAVLEREDLLKAFQEERDMLQWSIFVTVTVITDSGSDMVEYELNNIFIMDSPYKILYTKTSKYFKPGMTFDLMVFVTNPDGSPAHRVPVIAEPGSVRGSTLEDGTARLPLNTRSDISNLHITVSTTDDKIPKEKQAFATMTAFAYKPLYGNYLHLSVTGGELKVGENAVITFNIRNNDNAVQNQITQFNYVVMNKGRIMKVGTQVREKDQGHVTMLLPITEEFIPSFRILAYYTVTIGADREIVADSVWIDVEDTCMGTLSITGDKDKDNAVQLPGTSLSLKLQADHKAAVGLVAVDKGVYVINNKLKISQRKVWDSVEKYDIGCTPGSGANAPGVFYDAGLALQTSFNMATPQRSEPFCQPNLRRRRRSSGLIIQERNKKASQYIGLEKTCCEHGMLDNPMGYSCERRTHLIMDGEKCIAAFLDCCKHIKKQREVESALKTTDEDGRSDEDEEFIDDADITSRTLFPESWLWKTEVMNEAPDGKGISTKFLPVYLKDSITTWEVLAVSLSDSKGICVSKPHNIQVKMNFFIDLKLPYSVVRNEQVEIRAIIYNYQNIRLKLYVYWTYSEHFCSLSTAKKKFRQEVTIRPSSSVAATFIIVPLTLGYHEIEVKATGQGLSDGVKKTLFVVPEGRRLTKITKSVVLEPELRGGVQEERVSAVDPQNIVPNTRIDTIITIQGSPITEMVEKSIDGVNLNHLINPPQGCGEQNMMSMTSPLIATHYLDFSNQWEKIGLQRRDQAIQFIKNGVVQQLTFAKPDGSYGAWIHTSSSTWLTAYVVKVFSLASSLIDIQKNVICNAVKWLILNKLNPDGEFREDFPVYHQDMAGGIKTGAVELDASLTAFVLIAMLTSEETCKDQVNVATSIEKAAQYLNDRYHFLNKPYSIAITSYALAKAGKLEDSRILMAACTDNNHWNEPNSRFLSLEATSYALLTLLKLKEFEKAGPLVKWLTEQRYYGEIWGSTQSTMMQFEALAQYQIDVPGFKDLDMDVSFQLPGRSDRITHRLNLGNALLARSEQTKEVGDFIVTAKGKGQGTLTVFSIFHAFETETERKCNNFDVSVTIKEEPEFQRPREALSTVSITICTRFLKNQDATMSIIDMSMMTGYVPDINDLNKLKNVVDRSISNFEIKEGVFDKGTLIMYLDRIPHKEDACLTFHLHQYFKVGLIQPGSVTVYDYYSPENRCTKFYHLEEGSKLLGKICKGEVCRCAEENCFLQQQLDNVKALQRVNKACEPGVDYVFKATLTKIQNGDNYDNYVMTIITVIKEGTDVGVANEKRDFISHAKCRNVLNLKEGKDYVIWGVSKDLWNTANGFAYMITKDTWIENWPTNRDCQKAEFASLCDEFFNFIDEMDFRGCIS